MEQSLSSDDIVDIGEEHHRAGRLHEAESFYRKALEIDPGHPGALFLLANIAFLDERIEFSKQLLDELLCEEPNDAEAWHLLGMLGLKDEDFSKSKECIEKALSIQPTYVQAHYSLGIVLYGLGELNAALESHRKALALNPQFSGAHVAIGDILRETNQLDGAIDSYRQAIALNYGDHQTHANLALVYMLKQQNAEAKACFEQAISLDPNDALVHRNLGLLQLAMGKTNEGITTLQKSVELKPLDPELRINLALSLCGIGRLTDAINYLQKSIGEIQNNVYAHSILLSLSHYLPNNSREKIFSDHVTFAELFEAPLRKKWVPHPKPNNPKKRLRVGFVSADLCSHPVGYFLEGTLQELFRRNEIDIYMYGMNAVVDAVTDRLRAKTHSWLAITTLSDDAVEQRIRADKIDILIDLSGHTVANRLLVFARKPAPIQVTWLGYWETTGLQAVDYILCDAYSVFDGEEKFFVEKPWHLPHTRLCFTLPNENVAVVPLPARSNGFITFGCFNNLVKMTERTVALWARILQRVPNSRLMLKSVSFGDIRTRESVISRFAAEGIPFDRLLLEGGSPRNEYFLAYNRVDIALDPFPFTGGTTSVQGIWMGVPMITLRGDRIISRQGVSILSNLGLQDWIAENEDEYVEMAVRRSSDLASLANLRSQLRGKLEVSALCDAKLFAVNLEAAFRKMWEKYYDTFD